MHLDDDDVCISDWGTFCKGYAEDNVDVDGLWFRIHINDDIECK